MHIKIHPTAEIVKEIIGRGEKAREATFQICDVILPNERHPMTYKHMCDSSRDQLDTKQVYTPIGGLSINKWNSFEFNRYDMQLVPEKVYLQSLKTPVAAAS